MRVIDCVQGSAEWRAARCGRITASRICDVMARIQKGEARDRENYRTELIAERLTGTTDDQTFKTQWLKDGTENEPLARTAYELRTGNFCDLYGFVLHPWWDFSGASPDGLWSKGSGGVQIKCPKATTHLRWMEAGVVPPEHTDQMQWEMRCCELQGLDFVSFCPKMPEDLALFIPPTLFRDEKRIGEIEAGVERFEREIQAKIARLRGLPGSSVEGIAYSVLHAQLVESVHSAADAG